MGLHRGRRGALSSDVGICSLAHGGIHRHCGELRRSGVRYCDVGSSQGRGLRHGRSGVLDSNVGYVP